MTAFALVEAAAFACETLFALLVPLVSFGFVASTRAGLPTAATDGLAVVDGVSELTLGLGVVNATGSFTTSLPSMSLVGTLPPPLLPATSPTPTIVSVVRAKAAQA